MSAYLDSYGKTACRSRHPPFTLHIGMHPDLDLDSKLDLSDILFRDVEGSLVREHGAASRPNSASVEGSIMETLRERTPHRAPFCRLLLVEERTKPRSRCVARD